MLATLPPEQIEVEIWRADELEVRRGLASELDEMWSYVAKKTNPRWLWHAIDHHTGKVLAYVFGRRQDTVFLTLKALLELFSETPLPFHSGKCLMSIPFSRSMQSLAADRFRYSLSGMLLAAALLSAWKSRSYS